MPIMVVFSDLEESSNSLNGMRLKSRLELEGVLEGLSYREPFVFELVGDNGDELVVGIGDLGCVQFGRHDGDGLYQMALAPAAHDVDGYCEFLAGGTLTPILKRYCMPLEQVRQIMFHFLEKGGCSPEFSWEDT